MNPTYYIGLTLTRNFGTYSLSTNEMKMLETKRFIINAPVLSDLDNWHQLQANPQVMQYVGGARSRATIIRWLEQEISHYAAHGFCVGSVFNKKNM